MHQTFYIDFDEEVTSAIDRLRIAQGKQIVFVIPKGALLVQSGVNLRLLQREAGRLLKELTIVTADRHDRTMIKKIGIPVQSDLTGFDMENISAEMQPQFFEREDEIVTSDHPRQLGSTDFYDRSDIPGGQMDVLPVKNNFTSHSSRKNIENSASALVRESSPTHSRFSRSRMSDVSSKQRSATVSYSSRIKAQTMTSRTPTPHAIKKNPRIQLRSNSSSGNSKNDDGLFSGIKSHSRHFVQVGTYKTKTQDSFDRIGSGDVQSKSNKPSYPQKIVHVPKKVLLFISGILFIVVIFFSSVYYYFSHPNTDIVVALNAKVQKNEFTAQGKSNLSTVDPLSRAFPVHTVKLSKELKQSFDATGLGTGSDQKSRGRVVLKNNFSKEPQKLIKTTRLLSSEGKLFRLVDDTMIPGMIGEEPGMIEVLVVADQQGDSFNIPPTVFTIPGFQGLPEFASFSAESQEAMQGGGVSSNNLKVVTEEDITRSKEHTENMLRENIVSEIRSTLKEKDVLLDTAIQFNFIKSRASVSPLIAVDRFDYTTEAEVLAFVFSEDDLRKIVSHEAKLIDGTSPDNRHIKMEYSSVLPSFDKGELTMRVVARVLNIPVLDVVQMKKDLLGRNRTEIEELIRQHDIIKNVDISFSPSFMSERIPPLGNNVTVTIQDEILE